MSIHGKIVYFSDLEIYIERAPPTFVAARLILSSEEQRTKPNNTADTDLINRKWT